MSADSAGSKSPAAPSRSLQAALIVASKIYDQYGHTQFGGAEIAGAGEVSATSGQGKSLISDLKQYGLIDKKSVGRFAVSQDLKNLVALQQGSVEFNAAAFQLVRKPAIFQAVLSEAKGKLPEEIALANNLRSSQQFNQEKAKATAKALTDSLKWVGVLDSKRNILEPRISQDVKKVEESQDTADSTSEAMEQGLQVREKLLTLDIPVDAGRTVHVKYPHDLTPEEAAKVGKVLAAISM